MQVLKYQKKMTHPWSDMAMSCFEVDRYSHSQRDIAFGWWKVVLGKGVGVVHVCWSFCLKEGKKNACEISLHRKAEISDTTDLVPMNASHMGEWLWPRSSVSVCIHLGQTWEEKWCWAFDKFCKHVCSSNSLLDFLYIFVCVLTETFCNVLGIIIIQDSKMRYLTKFFRFR